MVVTRVRLWLISGFGLLAFASADGFPGPGARVQAEEKSKPRELTLRGKVLPLAEALKSVAPDLKTDADPIAKEVVLVGQDRSVVPLIPDEASRALFTDSRVQNRPVEIRGRQYPGLPHLQVITLRVEEEGRFRTPEYFCHVCAISLRYPQTCPCCQGPMEFRMKPDRP